MSAPEPTAEHIEEANRIAAEWTLLHLGNTGATANNLEVVLPRMIARALAAREARGFEKATDAAITHTMALEAQNVALLRWQSVASDAHVGHICALIRSLAVSDETPRTLRDLSAMGVEEEVRRIVAAERINREKSEVSAREWRKKAENAEADALDAEARGFERGRKEGGPVVAAVRALYALPEFPYGEWSCGECGNVYPRDIIAGCPTCSPAARAALYAKEPG